MAITWLQIIKRGGEWLSDESKDVGRSHHIESIKGMLRNATLNMKQNQGVKGQFEKEQKYSLIYVF